MLVCFVVSGVLMVTPLYLAITPTSVMQDPDLGPYFMRLMEESQVDDLDDDHVDDRLLIILFLVIERARGRFSFWAPYPFFDRVHDAICNFAARDEMVDVNPLSSSSSLNHLAPSYSYTSQSRASSGLRFSNPSWHSSE